MAISGKRVELATALSEIPDVTGHTKRPKAPKVGDAWPRLGTITRAGGYALELAWALIIVLPSNEESASEWIDEHVQDIFDELEPVAYIDSMEPVLITSSGGDIFALQVNVRSE